MNKLIKIQQKYDSILKLYQQKYSFNNTINIKFQDFNDLFKKTLMKEVNNHIVTIEKRNEYDLLLSILTMISGEFNKSVANDLEQKYKFLFSHREKVINILKDFNFNFPNNKIKYKPKDTRDPIIIKKPNYGYHIDNPRFPLLEDNDYF